MGFHESKRLMNLAPYASKVTDCRGRMFDELESTTRTPFQRDRDRIIHCSAFRRLNYKTQVFVYHEGDHYRSRLTHSLEVGQIARTIARYLSLDEDLAETLALAHDLGHPPFGHAGERALNKVMKDYGGFDHNAQSLRVVTFLERKYAEFDGLNLSWETLEGLVKHNGPLSDAEGNPIGGYESSGIPGIILDYQKHQDLDLSSYASAEAQVAAVADDIAYNNHDLDDGLRAGLLKLEHLSEMPITARLLEEIQQKYPDLEAERSIYELNRRLITLLVNDVLEVGRARFNKFAPKSVADIRNADHAYIQFSDQVTEELDALRFFLISWVYRDIRVERIMSDAAQIVRDLFEIFMKQPQKLPEIWAIGAIASDEYQRARLICDFVSGMTDRFAISEHSRLFDVTPDLR